MNPGATTTHRFSRLVLAAALLGLAAGSSYAAAGSADAVINRETLVGLSSSVLRIETQRVQGGYGFGSGVVLPGNRIVTNCHVTRDALAVHVLRGGARWRAETQAAAPELDICVLHVPAMVGKPVSIAKSLKLGQPVAAMGFMGGAPTPSVSDGHVVDLNRHAGAEVIQASTGFISGASGGGLFDGEGALAGILSFRLRGGEAHYFAAPTAWLAPLLSDDSRFHPVAPQRGAPLTFWELAADAQPRFLHAVSLAQGGAWDRLLGLGNTWARDDDSDAHGHYWRGLALDKLARTDDALASLSRASELSPLWDAPLEQLGLLHVQQGRLDAARQLLSRLDALRRSAGDKLRRALDQVCASRRVAGCANS